MKRITIVLWTLVLVFLNATHAQAFFELDMHGFISQGYLKSSEHNYLAKTEKGTYEFNEAGINFSSVLSDKLQIGLQLLARDLGDDGNNEIGLDWGFADYRFCNELGLRLGKLKVPFGLYNEGRDLDMLRNSILLPQGVYLELLRSYANAIEGGGIYGTVGLAGNLEYSITLGSTSVDFDNETMKNAVSLILINREDINNASLNNDYINANRVIWNTPLDGLRLGVTQAYLKAKVDAQYEAYLPYVSVPYSEGICMRMNVLSGEYKWKDLTLACEYLTWNLSLDIEPPFGAARVTRHQKQLGYYGSAAYRFTDWLEVGCYRSKYFTDCTDKDGTEQAVQYLANFGEAKPDYAFHQHDTALTMRFDITPFWLIKLEGHHMNGCAQVYNYDSVDDLKKVWSLYAVKTTFSF